MGFYYGDRLVGVVGGCEGRLVLLFYKLLGFM